MERFFKLTVIMLFLAGSFSVCNKGKENDANESEEVSFSTKATDESVYNVSDDEYVSMRISPESGSTKTPVKLVIENHTKLCVLKYGTDLSFKYAIPEEKRWSKRQSVSVFNEGGGLLPDETTELVFDLSLIEENNEGKKGIYRLFKDFEISSANEGSGPSTTIETNLSFEFETK